jgi:hypothetical protein
MLSRYAGLADAMGRLPARGPREALMHTYQENDIRDRAYALWVEAGSPDGDDQRFWHEAERQLAQEGAIDRSEEDADVELPPIVSGLPIH